MDLFCRLDCWSGRPRLGRSSNWCEGQKLVIPTISVKQKIKHSNNRLPLKSFSGEILTNNATDRTKTIESMRRDWDERARKNPYFYIASWRKDWDEESFFRSGQEDYRRLVSPVLERHGFTPRGKTMLELGCGAGRMSRSFAREFDRVLAFDVSAEMLSRAQALNHDFENITWVEGNGYDMSNIANGSVQFLFSYLVLQHLPNDSISSLLHIRDFEDSCCRWSLLVSIQRNGGKIYELERSA